MCGYWWRWTGDPQVHRCTKSDHPVGTDHVCDCTDKVSKKSDDYPGESR